MPRTTYKDRIDSLQVQVTSARADAVRYRTLAEQETRTRDEAVKRADAAERVLEYDRQVQGSERQRLAALEVENRVLREVLKLRAPDREQF